MILVGQECRIESRVIRWKDERVCVCVDWETWCHAEAQTERKKQVPCCTRSLELQLWPKPLSPDSQKHPAVAAMPEFSRRGFFKPAFDLSSDWSTEREDKVVAISRARTLAEPPTRGDKGPGRDTTDQAGQLWRSRALDQARLLICTRRTSAVTSPGMTSPLPALISTGRMTPN